METFPSIYFTFTTRYPETGTRLQFGNSYQFDAPPSAPDQRIFVLRLQGMAYFVDVNDNIDLNYEPGRNVAVLEQFYNNHKRAVPFLFNHPVYGSVVCKFNRPLVIPEGIAGGTGLVQNIEVELIELP